MLFALIITALAARATTMTIERVATEVATDRTHPGAVDGWGTPLLIEIDADGARYRIVSAGADKVFDPGSWTRPMDLDPRSDMVYESGSFKRRFDVDRWLRSTP